MEADVSISFHTPEYESFENRSMYIGLKVNRPWRIRLSTSSNTENLSCALIAGGNSRASTRNSILAE